VAATAVIWRLQFFRLFCFSRANSCLLTQQCRVARWFIFKPKILIWVRFVGVLQWKMLVYFMSYSHMVLFVVIWYILLSFGIFFRLGILYQEKSGNPAAVLT
jgi:hypothetical protein